MSQHVNVSAASRTERRASSTQRCGRNRGGERGRGLLAGGRIEALRERRRHAREEVGEETEFWKEKGEVRHKIYRE